MRRKTFRKELEEKLKEDFRKGYFGKQLEVEWRVVL